MCVDILTDENDLRVLVIIKTFILGLSDWLLCGAVISSSSSLKPRNSIRNFTLLDLSSSKDSQNAAGKFRP